ncbi:MAG: hypothetical protein KDD62_13950 [Bdellovibrionales bacterium]|nr:hypothetical protein [Bdellovibrionales bacterium]
MFSPHLPPSRSDLQITETGVSGDYWNEYVNLRLSFDVGSMRSDKPLQHVTDYIRDKPVKLYEERFTQQELDAHVDENVLGTIYKLNLIAHSLNQAALAGNLTLADLESAWNRAGALILGEGQFPSWE